MHRSHLLVCAVLVGVAISLVATGIETAALVPLLACALMMGAMMVMMSRSGGGDG